MPAPGFLLWCAVVNYALLLLAFAWFVVGRNWMYRFHHRWFDFPATRFDEFVFCFLALYKSAIWFFLIVPAVVLCLMR